MKFALVDLDLIELAVTNGVEALHANGHVAIRDTLDFKLMHANEIGDLLEGQSGVVNQPNGSCTGHDRFVHRVHSRTQIFPAARKGLSRRTVSIVGEIGALILRETVQGKSECAF